MISQLRRLRPVRSWALVRKPPVMNGQPAATHWLDRMVQVALALYLIPALLIVLVVGGIGMLLLAAVRLLAWVVRRPAGWPRAR
jgi:hypothetical protein